MKIAFKFKPTHCPCSALVVTSGASWFVVENWRCWGQV